jgi:hypothetical protein
MANPHSKSSGRTFEPMGRVRWETVRWSDGEKHWAEPGCVVALIEVEVAVGAREPGATLLHVHYQEQHRYHQTACQQEVYIRSWFREEKI